MITIYGVKFVVTCFVQKKRMSNNRDCKGSQDEKMKNIWMMFFIPCNNTEDATVGLIYNCITGRVKTITPGGRLEEYGVSTVAVDRRGFHIHYKVDKLSPFIK